MKLQRPFYLFLLSIPLLALIAGFCNNAGIKSHFYFWELLLDGKTIALMLLYVLLLKPRDLRIEARDRGVFKWSMRRGLGAFLMPVLISGVTLAIGLWARKVSYADPDNASTLLLTTLFDIPAVFIFSVTTVFIEEYIFRGCVLTEFMKSGKPAIGLIASAVLWAAYAAVEVLPLEDFSWMSAALLLVYYISIGVGASVLYAVSRSLWVSYAFRIGVMTVTPMVLSGVTGVTDAFFTTENIFFFGDGIISSVVILVIFIGVFAVALRKGKLSAVVVPA
jgi:membrane protease YdiL (CAAX protease family)